MEGYICQNLTSNVVVFGAVPTSGKEASSGAFQLCIGGRQVYS